LELAAYLLHTVLRSYIPVATLSERRGAVKPFQDKRMATNGHLGQDIDKSSCGTTR
jgi:hypothetical protein